MTEIIQSSVDACLFMISYMLTMKSNEDTANVLSCSIHNCNWNYYKAVLKYIAKGSLMILYDILSVSQFIKIA